MSKARFHSGSAGMLLATNSSSETGPSLRQDELESIFMERGARETKWTIEKMRDYHNGPIGY